jgi:NADPH:quinone reductase-like Zn-dependent oxidoreductase
MKACVYNQYGPPEVLRIVDIPRPAPGPGDVIIRVRATSVTSGDCNARDAVFVPNGLGFAQRLMCGLRKPKRPVLGFEFAGEIAAVGERVTRFARGDKVFGVTGMRFGAYAEYLTLPENGRIAHKPDTVSFEEAAAASFGATTALYFLRDLCRVRAGHSLCVYGASGCVGTSAVQLGRHFGARVSGVCGAGNHELIRAIGAEQAIDYAAEDFTRTGRTWDIIFDAVGKTTFAHCKKALNAHGVYCAGAGGPRELIQAMIPFSASGKRVRAGAAPDRLDDLLYIRDLLARGAFRPVIDRSYPLERIVEAHRYADSGHKRGNVVITVS